MKDWENYFAGSLIYQDLADCSLGSVPVLNELEQTNTLEVQKVAKQSKKNESNDENVIIVDVLQKASAFLFLLAAMVTTM